MLKSFSLTGAKPWLLAGAAALGLALAAAPASAGDLSKISFGMDGFDLDIGDEDFLEQLIAMDAEDIADLRADMAEAREDIREAIGEIEEARRDAESSPESRALIATAFAAASESVSNSTKGVFDRVRGELDRAERELKAGEIEVSAEEFAETTAVIAALRDELSNVELALGELIDALKA